MRNRTCGDHKQGTQTMISFAEFHTKLKPMTAWDDGVPSRVPLPAGSHEWVGNR